MSLTFIREVRREISKVAFPDKNTTLKTLGVVIFFFLVLSCFLGGLGFLFSGIIGKLVFNGAL